MQFKTALRGVLNAQIKYTKEMSSFHGGSGGGGGGGGGGGSQSSSAMGPELTIKLAKRNGGLPHLCLDIKDSKSNQEVASFSANIMQPQDLLLASSSSRMIGVHHAIPVRMMRVEELQYHVPPRLSMPDVQLILPNDRPLKNVIDRLRMMSPHGTYARNGSNIMAVSNCAYLF